MLKCLQVSSERRLQKASQKACVSYQILSKVADLNQTFFVLYHFGTCPAVADVSYFTVFFYSFLLSFFFIILGDAPGLSHLKAIQ